MIAILAIAILPYLVLSFFCHPIADDFVFAHQFQNSNYFSLIFDTYQNWTGRYFSNALIYLNPISFDFYFGYQLFSFCILILSILVLKLLTKTLFEEWSSFKIWIATLVLISIYLNIVPSLSEQFYWYTGIVIYHVGLLLVTLYATMLTRGLKRQNGNSLGFNVLLTIFLFVSLGFNEVLSILVVMSLTILVFVQRKNTGKKFLWWQWLASLLFLSFMLLAPGNQERQAAYAEGHQLGHALLYSSAQVIRFSSLWIVAPSLVFGTALFAAVYPALTNLSLIKKLNQLNKWCSLILLPVVVWIAAFPPYWATGILGQHRTLNIAAWFFIFFWFINLSVWFGSTIWLQRSLSYLHPYKKHFVALLLLSLFAFGNGYQVWSDLLSGRAKTYSVQIQHRHQLLDNLNQKDSDKIQLETPVARPKSIFVLEASNDPNHWTNKAYNLYYQTEREIVVK